MFAGARHRSNRAGGAHRGAPHGGPRSGSGAHRRSGGGRGGTARRWRRCQEAQGCRGGGVRRCSGGQVAGGREAEEQKGEESGGRRAVSSVASSCKWRRRGAGTICGERGCGAARCSNHSSWRCRCAAGAPTWRRVVQRRRRRCGWWRRSAGTRRLAHGVCEVLGPGRHRGGPENAVRGACSGYRCPQKLFKVRALAAFGITPTSTHCPAACADVVHQGTLQPTRRLM